MNKIVVSPKAVAVARRLRTDGVQVDTDVHSLDNNLLATRTGLTRDTLYRAFAELEELGAVLWFHKPHNGVRTVAISPDHWLFVAIDQGQAVEVSA